jgi:hypothetical protein
MGWLGREKNPRAESWASLLYRIARAAFALNYRESHRMDTIALDSYLLRATW